MKILHLEDNDDDAFLMRMQLERRGVEAEILPVTDRAGFLKRLESGPVDLLIVDNSLPGFSGLEAIRLAREIQPGIPCIVLSGALDETRQKATSDAGAVAYVLKDRPDDLVAAIESAVK
jgi:two-component system, NarL family, sensor histidine kinase UhpB